MKKKQNRIHLKDNQYLLSSNELTNSNYAVIDSDGNVTVSPAVFELLKDESVSSTVLNQLQYINIFDYLNKRQTKYKEIVNKAAGTGTTTNNLIQNGKA